MSVDLELICGCGDLGCLYGSETAVWVVCGKMIDVVSTVDIISRRICIDVGKYFSRMGLGKHKRRVMSSLQ